MKHALYLFASLLIAPAWVTAQEPEPFAAKINAANKLVQQGEYEPAIEEYQALKASASQRDHLNYNLAVAHFKNGDISPAAELFEATSKSSNTQVASDSRYNLGNCRYSEALQQQQEAPDEAIELLNQAITNYRSALRLDSTNADARANIELAVNLLDQLDQQNQDQQNQDQQNQDQQNQDQQSQDQQSQDQQSQDQQSQDQQSQSMQGQQDDPQEPPEQDANGTSKPADDADSEDKPEDRPNTATGELTSENDNQPPSQGTAVSGETEDERPMTREEALKLLQSVRDRDMIRRLQQERRERSRSIPVARDW